jgi:hypothetical protein
LGRDLNKTIILDNSPASYIFHPHNAVPCISWFDDTKDTELLDLIPYFEKLAAADSVYSILRPTNLNISNTSGPHSNYNQLQQQQQQHNINNTNPIHAVTQATYIHTEYVTTDDEDTETEQQEVPISQSIIYQAQPQTHTQLPINISSGNGSNVTIKQDNNNNYINNNNASQIESNNTENDFNYLAHENKMLMTIDLAMATTQQKLQQQQQQQQQSKQNKK